MLSVPILTIRAFEAVNLPLADGTPVELAVRIMSLRVHNVPTMQDVFISAKAAVKDRKVTFEGHNPVLLPSPFPVDDVLRLIVVACGDERQTVGKVNVKVADVQEKASYDVRKKLKVNKEAGEGQIHFSIDFTIPGGECDSQDSVAQAMCTAAADGGSLDSATLATIFKGLGGATGKDKAKKSGVMLTLGGTRTSAAPEEHEAEKDLEFVPPVTMMELPWEKFPVSVEPHTNLDFGLGMDQAPLNKEITQELTLTNRTHNVQLFEFSLKPPRTPKYRYSASPGRGVLQPGESKTVRVCLTMLCTTATPIKFMFKSWAQGADSGYTAYVRAALRSEMSTILDPDELALENPPMGEGSFGIVFRGSYRGIDVAVKLMKDQPQPGSSKAKKLMDAFNMEVHNAERLRHPAIVSFVGAIYFDNMMSLVTEFCPYGSLESALGKYAFTWAYRLKALLDIANAMNFLHKSGYMHRDLKTENVLVCDVILGSSRSYFNPVVKLADFGTSRGIGAYKASQALHVTRDVGTPVFMAPEVLQHSNTYTQSVDVYSFGIIMGQVATSELPYDDDDRFSDVASFYRMVISGMRPLYKKKLPADFREIMESCTVGDPNARPTFENICESLLGLLQTAKN